MEKEGLELLRKTVSWIMLTLLLVSMGTLTFNIQPVKADPEVLFFDDFNDGIADGWTEHLGTWNAIGGEYLVTVGVNENGISTVDNLNLTDCVIETKLRFRDTEVGFNVGIVFRYTDNEHLYTFEVSNEYDEVLFHIFTPEDPEWGHGPPCLAYPINSNVNYTLRVEIRGQTFTGFLNGQQVYEWTDGNYTSGKVGLRARRAHVFFDNFTVYDSQSLWWNNNWQHRRKVHITENSGYDLSDFPVEVTFEHDGNAQPDGDDIRVIDNLIEIPSLVTMINNTHASVMFEIDALASSSKSVYVYYGNPSVTAPSYPLVPLTISEGNTGYAIIDNALYIGWTRTVWGGSGPEVTVWADYRIDFDRNGDPEDNDDLITDYGGRKGGIGRFVIHFHQIGLGDYQRYIQTPIYIDIVFANASLRAYENHTWVETTQADELFMFSPSWDYANYGLGSEQNIIDGLNVNQITPSPPWHYPWNEMYISPLDPQWMTFRNSMTGEIFGSTGLNIGTAYNYSFTAKEGADWDRCIRYDFVGPDPSPEPYDQPTDCRIYWYGDNSNNYSNIEMMAQIFHNQPSILVESEEPKAGPKTWTVDDDGPADFHIIQEAINSPDVKDGDTIFVYNGTYYENVVVNKSVSLIGENRETAIIDGNGTGHVVHVTANNTIISNFTIQNSGHNKFDRGICIQNSFNSSIYNNKVKNNNWEGIHITQSSYCILRNNNITDSEYWNFGVTGGNFEHYIHDIDSSNTVNGKPIHYLINEKNLAVNPSTYGNVAYLALVNSTNITVEDLNLRDNFHGVLFAYTSNSLIKNVSVTHTHDAILIHGCSNVSVSGNIANNNWHTSVRLYHSFNCSVSRNTAIDNENIGIWLEEGSPNCSISENTVKYQRWGIWVTSSSDNCSVYGNIVTNNWYSGIWIEVSNCILKGNTISNNGLPGWGDGLRIKEYCKNTMVYHNNFINNINQHLGGVGVNTTWDNGYPSGGNYWSDYTGVDSYRGFYQNETGSDGIGDTPYLIDANNRDRYPLMNPYSAPPSAEIHDVSIVSVVPSATEVYVGQVVNITVTVQNQGNITETFQVTCKYELEGTEYAIGIMTVDNLAPQANTSIIFTWTTTDITVHIIKAEIPPLIGETDTADNTLTSPTTVKVKMIGDVNGDNQIDIRDIAQAALAFGSYLNHPRWTPQADINQDGKVDIRDLAFIAKNFGKTYP